MKREQLEKLLDESEQKLNNLKGIQYDGLTEQIVELESLFKELKEGGESLLSNDNVLQIGIVGQVKAGKSSFLNSLFFDGESVLPKASTPMTAGLTILEYADKNTFEVEYFNENDWSIFVNQDDEYKRQEQEIRANNPGASESIIQRELQAKIKSDKIRSAHEMVSSCSLKAKEKIGKKNDVKEFFDIEDLQNVLEQFVGANGEFTSVVKSLYIKMNDKRLQGLRIVDTPGVNDPVVSRENRTRTFLHSCHGVFLLSSSSDFLSSGDVSFLNTRIGGAGIGSVVLLASKFDSVLQDIGAQNEMNHTAQGDLGNTIELQQKKFKRRLRELRETIDEKLRERIELDITSGIGFSIARKPQEKWDEVERNVVRQMQHFYPDYFSDENLRETFEILANITGIRNNYLKGVFQKNKETIIEEKIKNFFVKNKQEIASSITRILEDFNGRKEQLNATTIEEIRKQKTVQEQLFVSLQSEFSHIFNDFKKSIQREIKSIANRVRFSEIRHIPDEEVDWSVTHKGMLWGHNTTDMTIRRVNAYELQESISKAIAEYSEAWNEEWKKLFNTTRMELADKLNLAISDYEKQIMSSSFNDAYYRNLIERVLDDMKDCKELSIGKLIQDYQRQGDDIARKEFIPSGTEELKEVQVKTYLESELTKHKNRLISEFRILADSLQQDVNREVNQNLEGSITLIENMEKSFAGKLKQQGEEYLAQLEKDMSDKTEVLKKIDTIIQCLSEMNALYK